MIFTHEFGNGNNNVITLDANITIASLAVMGNANMTIDLNGYGLTITGNLDITDASRLIITTTATSPNSGNADTFSVADINIANSGNQGDDCELDVNGGNVVASGTINIGTGLSQGTWNSNTGLMIIDGGVVAADGVVVGSEFSYPNNGGTGTLNITRGNLTTTHDFMAHNDSQVSVVSLDFDHPSSLSVGGDFTLGGSSYNVNFSVASLHIENMDGGYGASVSVGGNGTIFAGELSGNGEISGNFSESHYCGMNDVHNSLWQSSGNMTLGGASPTSYLTVKLHQQVLTDTMTANAFVCAGTVDLTWSLADPTATIYDRYYALNLGISGDSSSPYLNMGDEITLIAAGSFNGTFSDYTLGTTLSGDQAGGLPSGHTYELDIKPATISGSTYYDDPYGTSQILVLKVLS